MQILQQLGANSTAFVQLLIFIVTISILTIYVFSPYYKAYDQRLQNTKGAENVAKEAVEEAKNLSLVFQTKAREQNDKIKSIFDQEKKGAEQIIGEILKKSKDTSDVLLNQSRQEIADQVKKSKDQVQSLSQEIAKSITDKLQGGL